MRSSDDQSIEQQVDDALAEYMQKCAAGERPDRESFLLLHPDLRERLSELLSAPDWAEQLSGRRNVDGPPAASEEETCDAAVASAGDDSQATQAFVADFTGGVTPEASPPQGASSGQFSLPILPCHFGEYLLERVLGRGGMGVVYFGRQVQLDRPVAIKMIRSGVLASHNEVLRFYAEARSAAQLDHPNIVTVHQCGAVDGHRYFSMDYVAGTDLSKLIESAPLDTRRAARYVRDAARAIQYAHERGIVHRDLKPANVLVDESDQIHITDFGLAKSVGKDTGLTASGAALGTPSYMSPEQAAGRVGEQNQATDIYSLGAVLFTIVTGQPPFKSGSVVQTILHVIHRPAPMARSVRGDIPADLETIIDVCLQKSPERRYNSAAALADDLERFLLGAPIAARPASHLRRCWYWLLGIPIFGALLDNRVIEPTETHRWVQRGLISVAILMMLTWLAVLVPSMGWVSNRMPATVRVAGGIDGGSYDAVAHSIADALTPWTQRTAQTIATLGSTDNAERLERGEVEFALLQADALSSPSLVVVAPLYYEALHILVKQDLPITTLEDLRGRRVVLGSEKSGVRTVARALLARAGMTFDDIHIDSSSWPMLKQQTPADAVLIVARIGAAEVVELCNQGSFRLLPVVDYLQFAMDEPDFRPVLLNGVDYPNCDIPEGGVASLATTAFLAARADAPPVLVQTVLQCIYAPDVLQRTGILSPERAAHWTGLAWHPTARAFFQAYQGSPIVDR